MGPGYRGRVMSSHQHPHIPMKQETNTDQQSQANDLYVVVFQASGELQARLLFISLHNIIFDPQITGGL